MRVLVQITHPAHVHFFRPYVELAPELGHTVRVLALEKEMSLELLDAYGIDYETACEPAERDLFRVRDQLRLTRATYRAAREFDPDVLTAIGGTSIAHVSTLVRGRSVVFYDTEHATLQNTVTYPFADRICTPTCYSEEIGSNHVRYPGYQELAYLHPARFTPESSIREEAGLGPNERFVVLRLIGWDAVHDVGGRGFDDVTDVVDALESTGVRVCITAESSLPPSLHDRRLSVPPHRVHHLLAEADAFIGESPTMATESAVLGTPAIFVSSLRLGYIDELEDEYGLVSSFAGPESQSTALSHTLSILEDYDRSTWASRRQQLLDDKTDTTAVLVDQLEVAGVLARNA
ncbi:hypothetical protein Halru_2864 [Halovivax ruber XH-70]|uniref:DUF354 domain-containing protein n=1 Tax=Halovivax ruber (strain DSM 18193 / JCM 13892 / XH-70) TaxID=797302 RepID=L0IF98_HALRX|nr:DUF354 domain-containing protein [Halovivax ruber]AGB17434.1 hypothetical protein Halru_2864 [Halovivax ruber XH-70]